MDRDPSTLVVWRQEAQVTASQFTSQGIRSCANSGLLENDDCRSHVFVTFTMKEAHTDLIGENSSSLLFFLCELAAAPKVLD